MTNTRNQLHAVKSQFDDARRAFIAATKEAIREGLDEAFADPEINSVAFGVATAPYNDENSGQGVYGPVINFLTHDDDITFEEAAANFEFNRDEEYALFYYRPQPDSRAKLLGDVLATADWEFAAEALGVSYYPDEGHGQDMAFIATRNSAGGYDFEKFQVGEY